MSRKAIGITALIAAIAMTVLGGLSLAGGLFIHNRVTDELQAQKISFAPAGSPGLPADIAQYGGTQVTTGAQAKVFANSYIKPHIQGAIDELAKTNAKLDGVTTYAEVSSLSRATPDDQALSGLVQTVFRGEMLRASLLSSYAWWTFGTILFWVAMGMFGLAFAGVVTFAALATPLAARFSSERRHGGKMAHA